jgi:hypothetical protein
MRLKCSESRNVEAEAVECAVLLGGGGMRRFIGRRLNCKVNGVRQNSLDAHAR